MNLKEAARRLGVHYQTAYRWVRSGDLVAVRVGSRYEVSEAAIERLRAQRRAIASPPIETELRVDDGLEAELAKMADGPVLDVEQAVAHLARRIAETTGDLCVVAALSETRDRVEAATCFEPDSLRLPVLAGAIAATMRMRAPDEGPVMRTVFEGNQLFVPHVPQELFRAWLPPEFHQQFDDVCIFGMVAAPMIHDGIAAGGVALMREHPEHPFTSEDADRVDRLAMLAGDVVLSARQDRAARALLAAVLVDARAQVVATGRLDPERALGPSGDPVAVHDADDRVLAMTPAYTAIADRVRSRSTARIVSGELDFASDVCLDEAGTFVVHHAGVRALDATLLGIITVVRRTEREAAPQVPRLASPTPTG
jgi:excisionase family DNA binding protein